MNIEWNLNKHCWFFLWLHLSFNINLDFFRRSLLYLFIWSLFYRTYAYWLDRLIWLRLRLILFYSWGTWLNIWISWSLQFFSITDARIFTCLFLQDYWHSVLSLCFCYSCWNRMLLKCLSFRLYFGLCHLFLWYLFSCLLWTSLLRIFMNCLTFSMLFFKSFYWFCQLFLWHLTFYMSLMLLLRLFGSYYFSWILFSLWMLNLLNKTIWSLVSLCLSFFGMFKMFNLLNFLNRFSFLDMLNLLGFLNMFSILNMFSLLSFLNMFRFVNMLNILYMLNFVLNNLRSLMLLIRSYLANRFILIDELRPFHLHNIINMHHTYVSSISLFLKIVCYNTISKMLPIK